MKDHTPRWSALTVLILVMGLIVSFGFPTRGYAAPACTNTVVADVVALDQNYFINRLGALNNLGMVYALKRDVYTNAVDANGEFIGQSCAKVACVPGQVVMRPDKRPRPIALRVAKGDCLQINFTNLLNPVPIDPNEQNVTRDASAHVTGLQLVNSIADDGSWVGRNASSLVAPGGTATYTYYAQDENVFMITNMANTTGSEGAGGSLTFGLTGVVIVEPGNGTAAAASEFYRSHVANEDIALAACKPAVLASTTAAVDCLDKANQNRTAGDQPIINYNALYPNVEPFITENKANLPILNMQCTAAAAALGACALGELVHSDIHAIITGPNQGKFVAGTTYPSTSTNPRQDLPFREAASVFGDEQFMVQAYPLFFNNPVLKHTLNITKDGFVINYAGGGIGPEILSNRLGVGPTWDCPECKAEEFFLTSWALGDVGMWVDIPSNGCIQNQNLPLVNGVSVDPNVVPLPGLTAISCENGGGVPTPGPKATVALYPDDPSTIHHAYIHDHFKFRNIHAGPFEHHIFHLHNNQWVFSPKSDKANYMDMQQIGPGSSYTMDLTNEGAGNRNANPGDAIYHCHFYPHFAQGMWSDLRMHDVFEEGTVLNPRVNAAGVRVPWALRDAPPAPGSRAYPDGEVSVAAVPGTGTCIADPNFNGLCTGSPVVGLVPVPLNPMAPAPAVAAVNPADPRRIVVTPNPVTGQTNAGFPFYMPGVAGHRPPSPPLDIAVAATGPIDGGLPRHVVTGGTADYVVNRYDLNKELVNISAELVPEAGSPAELASFAYHAQRCHDTFYPDGTAATCVGPVNTLGNFTRGGFITNGLPPKPGAPHSDPCVDNLGNPITNGQVTTWNKPECALGRTDNPAACTGFTFTGGPFDNANPRPYKITNIQIDLVLNKNGWHSPQQRIISLWGDVAAQYAGTLPPAPMVFRLNTLDCAEVWHANLVPNFYELDDFQIRTPTDIIAQHSHMTKFDVASSDGAANLWNYEDGTFSPGEVVERIEAIDANGGLIDPVTNTRIQLTAKTHPYFEGLALPYQTITVAGCTGKTCGTRTTVQRWLADPVLDNTGVDRGIGNVFSHDHFGPSTFQQLGLYATILAEPAGSQWLHNETGLPLATRVTGGVQNLLADGGPTSWQAAIIPPAAPTVPNFNNTPYREFYFENSDFQQSYKRAFGPGSVLANLSFLDAVARPSKDGDPLAIYVFNNVCPGLVPSPCPMAIGGADQGTEVVNYRNEPVGKRIFDPLTTNQAAGFAGDLSFAFASILRADPDLNLPIQAYVRNTTQCPSCIRTPGLGTCGIPGAPAAGDPLFDFECVGGIAALTIPTPAGIGPEIINPAGAALTKDVGNFDPATPMMRINEGDLVKIRMQVGATEESHHFSLHGNKWLMNYADPNSGWRNVQSMGISEQFQFDFPVLGDLLGAGQRPVDYLYASNMSNTGLWNGQWGILRAYAARRPDLFMLPNNIKGNAPAQVANRRNFNRSCPNTAPVKTYNVTAIMARDVLPAVPGIVNPLGGLTGGTLVYNSRPDVVPANNIPGQGIAAGGAGPLHDPAAIIYALTADLPGLTAGTIAPEPLILRANSGDCVIVNLTNALPAVVPDLNGISLTYDPVVDKCVNDICTGTFKNTFNSNDIVPSANVGLHAQLLSFGPATDDGNNVGQNAADALGNVQPNFVQTAAPGATKQYIWYAGDLVAQQVGNPNQNRVNLLTREIEFGVVGLSPSDKLEQASRGLMGALVIEPKGQICTPDATTRAQATCTGTAGTYREFVALTQNNVKMYFADNTSIAGFPAENPAIGVADDPEDSGLKGVNYKSEPYWFRLKMAPATPLNGPQGQQTFATAALYSNTQVGGDPETPIFTANRGTNIRFYYTEPAGNSRSDVPVIHGHPWQRIPYLSQAQLGVGTVQSAVIGNNPQSQVVGSQEGYGPAGHWNFIPVVPAGGGGIGVAGDYLYRMQNPQSGFNGSWGLFRVQ